MGQVGLGRREMAKTIVRSPRKTISTRTSIEKLTVKSRPTKNGSKYRPRSGGIPVKILVMRTDYAPQRTQKWGVGIEYNISHCIPHNKLIKF